MRCVSNGPTFSLRDFSTDFARLLDEHIDAPAKAQHHRSGDDRRVRRFDFHMRESHKGHADAGANHEDLTPQRAGLEALLFNPLECRPQVIVEKLLDVRVSEQRGAELCVVLSLEGPAGSLESATPPISSA